MKKGFVSAIVFILWNANNAFGYRIFYMKESGSCNSSSVEINIGSLSRNSSGILRSGKSSIYEPDLNCSISLRPPLSYGLVVSIRSIDLEPLAEKSEDCDNYLEISPVKHHGSVKLCGYSYDESEFQSYTNWGGMRISFHTSNNTSAKKASFQLTFTAVRSEDEGFCFKEEKRCRNHNCIWKGLFCDGHNNCGDLSDEIDKHIAHCGTMSPGESLAVILVTIIGSLILLFIAACLRGPKITQQIERLTQAGRAGNNSDASVASNSDSSPRTAIPTANRIRTNYGSTSQFFTSCDFSDVMYPDPPPKYEEIQSTSQTPVTAAPSYSSQFPVNSSRTFTPISQVPVISSQISALPQVSASVTGESVPPRSVIENYVDSNPPGYFA